MSAVWVRVRAEVGARWRAWAGLVVLLGLFGGAVIAIAAGARRTDTAYRRFLADRRAYDVSIPNFQFDPAFANPPLDEVRRLPEVADSVQVKLFEASVNEGDGSVASIDPRFGTSFNGVKVLDGRLPSGPSEAAAPFMLAKAWHLHVGTRITIPFLRAGSNPNSPGAGAIVRLSLRIVGIEAAPGEFPPTLSQQPVLFMSSAFVRAYASRIATVDDLLVRLKRGSADIPAFTRAVNTMVSKGKVVFLFRQVDQAGNVDRSFHLQAIALWILAALTASVALLVLGQALSRQTFLESVEYPTLGALGMTRGQLMTVAFVRASLAGAAGATLALVVGVAVSPLFPTGLARIAEPRPGLAFDGTVIGIGAAATLAAVLIIQLVPAWHAARSSLLEGADDASLRGRPSVASAVAKAGAPPTTSAGVRLALERGRGRTAVPVRSTVLGVTIAIAAFTAALTFGTNLNRLLGTPRLYGVNWDLQLSTTSFRSGEADRVVYPALRDDPRIDGLATGAVSIPFEVGGHRVDAVALAADGASVAPPIIQGRLASNADEIVLGTKTLQSLHVSIGSTVQANVTGIPSKPFRVVGVGIMPPVGDVGRLGEGALVAYSSLSRFVPHAPPPNELLIRLVPGTSVSAFVADFKRRFPGVVDTFDRPQQPSDLVNFGRVQNMPVVLAGLLAALAAGTLAHMLVLDPPSPPGPGHPQDGRVQHVADLRHRGVAGHLPGPHRSAARRPARDRRWAMGVAGVRQRIGNRAHPGDEPPDRAAHGPGHGRAGEPHRRGPRPDRSADAARSGAQDGIGGRIRWAPCG